MGEQEPKKVKKHICAGLLAHVDAGKTTLSEALLYTTGAIRSLGRVDHQDTVLDSDALERQRGITIFSKQAVLQLDGLEITLLDTPGHVDFSAEMERTLQVLDCAILVISGTSGVQPHTRTLWRLLARHSVPTFLFINKMDLPSADHNAILKSLQSQLDEGCVDFTQPQAALCEEAAMLSEDALAEYLESHTLSPHTLSALTAARLLFPCWFGSALKLDGVEKLLRGIAQLCPRPTYPEQFGARVYKIGRDAQDVRLTYMKITGGCLRVKDSLSCGENDGLTEKVEQIRIYSGTKYRCVGSAEAGTICAVPGLAHTYSGQCLGIEKMFAPPTLEPVLNYRLVLPDGTDPHEAFNKLRLLAEEDPLLHISWSERLQEIHLQLMGQVQLEVLQELISKRFGLAVDFDAGGIVYKETICAPVEGIGHYEPLRHYAEVHLLLEPGKPGSGLHIATACAEDNLDRNWQRLILTHLAEKQHLGVLTGSPITDMKITLIAGRAHLKHTEGGDFRQATYRAVRQGLMSAESVLLEPWYDFRLEVPASSLGHAMNDIQQMGGRSDPPQTNQDTAILTGRAPVSEMGNYWQSVTAYTRGLGRLSCVLAGYAPCHNAQEAIAQSAYDPERDLDNPPDSVFCAHGAGYTVKWNEVPNYAHISSGLDLNAPKDKPPPRPVTSRATDTSIRSREEDAALQAIFERTYGPVKRREFQPVAKPAPALRTRTVPPQPKGPEYLLVDGYNIIFAWDELKDVAQESLEGARYMLMDLMCNYGGFKKCIVILVFDAYKVKGNPGSVEHYRNIHVVYTKEAETADAYIERATYEIAKNHRVRVATSDNLEQLIILGHGAIRVTAKEFRAEVEAAEGRIAEIIAQNNWNGKAFRQLRHQIKQQKKGET